MSGLPTYYAQQMLDLHNRYNLSENMRELLKAHDQWRMGHISQDQLCRKLKMSPKMRQACIETIAKVNNTMKKKPEEQKMCVEIIQACTDILTALEKPNDVEGFPFMKLPLEVRENVYGQYLNARRLREIGAVTISMKNTDCFCPKYIPAPYDTYRRIDLALARTSSIIRHEFLRYFYGHFSMNFTCSCELSQRLQINQVLRSSVRTVTIHWTGPKSDEAFRILAACRKLKNLTVIVSRSTTGRLTPRETEIRKFFTGLRAPRLPDALGMDELLQIRGIEQVIVSHVSTKQADRRGEDERAHLEGMLRSKLTQPRPDGDDDDEGF
ncbi:hypothetical protein V8F20_000595 [Naviculisporaceae sp. PSN 640]